MEKRERKLKIKPKAKRGPGKWVIWAVVGLAAAVLLFFAFRIISTPEAANPLEVTPELTPAPTPEPTPEPEPTLQIPKPEVSIYTAKLSIGEDVIQGSMQLHYVNNSGDTLFAIPFHLYPNTLVPDTLQVKEVSLDGRRAYFTVEEDVLNVPLVMELEQGEDCMVYVNFTLNLATGAYGGKRLTHVLPVAAVYENGWMTDTAPEDAAYTAPAIYSVIIDGAVEECSIPKGEDGYYYGENAQGLSITLE